VLSIFERQALSDFVDPLFELIESGMHGAIVEIENIAERDEPENPMVALDVVEHSLDRVTDKIDRVQHNIHGVLQQNLSMLDGQDRRSREKIPLIPHL
jgi:hypothetical protein